MNYYIFQTGGDWDSTTLYNNGEEVLANQLFVELHAGRGEDGEPTGGGLSRGGEATAFVTLQEDPAGHQQAIFPGKLEMEFPTHKLIVENHSAMFAIEMTRIWVDGQDVTNDVTDLFVNIDATNNEVSAYLTLYKSKFFGSDEVITYTLL